VLICLIGGILVATSTHHEPNIWMLLVIGGGCNRLGKELLWIGVNLRAHTTLLLEQLFAKGTFQVEVQNWFMAGYAICTGGNPICVARSPYMKRLLLLKMHPIWCETNPLCYQTASTDLPNYTLVGHGLQYTIGVKNI